MRRRSFVAGTSTVMVGLAGCLGDRGSSGAEAPQTDDEPGNQRDSSTVDGTETPTETQGSPDPVEDIVIDTHNSSPDAATVQITVSSDEQSIVDEELMLDPGERQYAATGIRETGQYELMVVVEGGPEGSFPFKVGDYALHQGSNLIVQIHEDDISILIEE